MIKRIILTIFGLLVLVGVLGGIKGLQIQRMISYGEKFTPPPATVTAASVVADSWESRLISVGSLDAVEGVTVSAELNGKVVGIAFKAGTKVHTGDLLLQQDISSEQAQLRAATAKVTLAKINLDRLRKLLAEDVGSRAEYDNVEAEYKQAVAEADRIRAIIAKKTIRAPFSGRIGIRLVNLGQILNEGDPIVSLQALDPIFVNFSLPQHELARVRLGFTVRIDTDALEEGQVIEGPITAINPQVDRSTRNIRMQATLANSAERLRPGMFVNVSVVLPSQSKVLAIPSTAVLYAPYGDSVFIVEKPQDEKGDSQHSVLRQQFIRLGEKRGDFISVASGVKEGQLIVSTGVFKLRNGQAVRVDNRLAPEFKKSPSLDNT
jgi:membrane fusion protein (multidrug efflux system)